MSRRTGARCGAFFCVESTGCSALTRQCVFALLYVLKQCAGARLRLAGFSSGRDVGARGGLFCAVGRVYCGGEEPLRLRFALPPPLSGKAFGARLTKPWQETQAVSHERGGVAAGDGGVALSFCAGHTFLSEYLAFVSRLLFAAERQTGRLAGCSVPISRGSGSPLERSQRPCGYRDSLVHFGFARFFMAIPTENEKTELAARRSALLRRHIGFAMLSAGRTLGLRAPDCAKESLTLWTLFI